MDSAIYFAGSDGSLQPLHETPFATENVLQQLIAEHPEVLDLGDASRWLVISREMGVPAAELGSDRCQWTICSWM